MRHARDKRYAAPTSSAWSFHRVVLCALFLSMLSLSACGGGGTSATPTASSLPPNPSFTNTATPGMAVAGVASKGPLVGAQITIFVLTADDSRGEQIAGRPVTDAIVTQTDGTWTTVIPLQMPGPFLLIATGGGYVDEATGIPTVLDPTAAILGLLPREETRAAITPVTHTLALAVQHALQTATAAGQTPDVADTVTMVIRNAASVFSFDPVRTLPPDPRNLAGQSTAQVQYAAILGGLSQLLATAQDRTAAGLLPTLSLAEWLDVFARDLTDGVVDGKQHGQAIALPDSTIVPGLLSDQPAATLAQMANAFAANPPAALDRAVFQHLAATAPVVITPPPGGDFAALQTTPPDSSSPLLPPAPTSTALTDPPDSSGTSPATASPDIAPSSPPDNRCENAGDATAVMALAAFQAVDCPQDTSDATAQEHTAIATANIWLAVDLSHAYHNVLRTQNFVFAPFNIAYTLAMMSVGAAGDTLAAVLDELHTPLPSARVHPALHAATLDLTQRNALGGLQQHSALWGQGRSVSHADTSYQFSAAFLETLARDYEPLMTAVDFTDPLLSLATATITPWIAEQTAQHIQGLLDFGSIAEKTRVVTASTTALDSLWQAPFDPSATLQGRFELLDKTQVQVPLMTQTGVFDSVRGAGYQAFELPLANSHLAVLIIMPDAGGFETFQASLTVERLQEIVTSLTPTSLTVYLPVTAITTRQPLAGSLDTLRTSGAFTEEQADFAGVNNAGFLFVQTLNHGAVLTLQEQGPQAAGATVVAYQATRDEPPSVWHGGGIGLISTTTWPCDSDVKDYFDPSLSLARPFLFAIRDHDTGSLLAMGQLLTPGGEPLPPDVRVVNTSCVSIITEPVVDTAVPVVTSPAPPVIQLSAAELHGQSLVVNAGTIELIDDPTMPDTLHIIGSAPVTSQQPLMLSGDTVRIMGDMALFRESRSALHLTATEKITMGIVQITAGTLDVAQSTLSIEGEQVLLTDHPTALRQGVMTVDIVGHLSIRFPAGSNVVQVTDDGFVIQALSTQTIDLPQGQVILYRTEDGVALTKGTIVLPADAPGGGAMTLSAGATAP